MTFRAWKYEDILAISRLETECFPSHPWSYGMLVSLFETDTFKGVVAEDGGEIVGYGGVTVAADSADIENIAVSENYRRGGIGEEILKRLIAAAAESGALKVFLEVCVSNSPALCMYLKNGFNGVYARTRYYPDGSDCLVMAKEL